MEGNEEVAQKQDLSLGKKLDRRLRNTLAARRSRQRKVDRLASLEQDLDKAKETLNAIKEKLKECGIDLEQFVSQPEKFSVVSNPHFASLAGNTAARTSPQLDPAQLDSDLCARGSYSPGPPNDISASGENDISGYNSEVYTHGLPKPWPKELGDSDLFSAASLGYDATPTHASLQAAIDPSTHSLREDGANDHFLKETDRFVDSLENRDAEPLVRHQSAAELQSPVREKPASLQAQEDRITEIEKFFANLDNEKTFSGEQASTTETGGTSIKRPGSPLQRTPGTSKIQRLGALSAARSDEDQLLRSETSVKDPVDSWELRGLSKRPEGRGGR